MPAAIRSLILDGTGTALAPLVVRRSRRSHLLSFDKVSSAAFLRTHRIHWFMLSIFAALYARVNNSLSSGLILSPALGFLFRPAVEAFFFIGRIKSLGDQSVNKEATGRTLCGPL